MWGTGDWRKEGQEFVKHFKISGLAANFSMLLYVSYFQVQLLNISPVVVGWLLTLMISGCVDFVAVVVGVTASTVVVKEESVPAIHMVEVVTAIHTCTSGREH